MLRTVHGNQICSFEISLYFHPALLCISIKHCLKILDLITYSTIFRYTDYIDFQSELPQKSVAPFCAADLPFSMITMEHLEGLMNRDQLKNYAEKDLNKHIFAEYQLETIGHRIKYSLDKVRQEYPMNWIQLERYILQVQTLSQNLTGLKIDVNFAKTLYWAFSMKIYWNKTSRKVLDFCFSHLFLAINAFLKDHFVKQGVPNSGSSYTGFKISLIFSRFSGNFAAINLLLHYTKTMGL